MNIDILHFDTLLGQYNNSVYDCTFAYFEQSAPIRNVQKIYLKSIEIPISFNNIRVSNGTNTFKINGFIITINENSYTSITTLLNDINIKVHLVLPNVTFGVENQKVVMTTNTTITFNNSRLLSVILGFTKLYYPNTSFSENNYLLGYDNYISIYFQDLPVKSTNNQLISYKIPLNAVNGMVYYMQELNSFSQFIEITDSNYILNRIRVIIYDRFGCILTNGLDYSFSLAINNN